MDKKKIGEFIVECRNNQNITQKGLSEKVNISISKLSKWENGACLPDVSIMPKLCEELGITINELISGERLKDKNYIEKAESNLLYLKKLEEKNKVILKRLKIIILVISILSSIIMTFIGTIAQTETIYRIVLFIVAAIVLVTGIYFSIKINKEIS